jgi:hypothetical protein
VAANTESFSSNGDEVAQAIDVVVETASLNDGEVDMVFLCFCIAEFGGYSFMEKTLLNIFLYEEYSSSYFIYHAYDSIYRATNKTNF